MATTLQYQTGKGHSIMAEAIARSIIGTMTYLAPTEPLVGEAACEVLEEAILECISASQIHLVLDLVRLLLDQRHEGRFSLEKEDLRGLHDWEDDGDDLSSLSGDTAAWQV